LVVTNSKNQTREEAAIEVPMVEFQTWKTVGNAALQAGSHRIPAICMAACAVKLRGKDSVHSVATID
jgi:hypothetical protein